MLTPIDPFQYVESSPHVRRLHVRPCDDRRKGEPPHERRGHSPAFRLVAAVCALGLAVLVCKLVLTIPW